MFVRAVLAIIVVFVFVSYGEADNVVKPPVTVGKTPLEIVKQLEEEGKYPKLDRDEQNLLGEDKNNDGVRD
ncbi:MAG: hypothetical protein LBU73_03115, partial [Helicobacteraceae bacterium]|nr:hypothetical protein [Helicobacteraceae bacterium]